MKYTLFPYMTLLITLRSEMPFQPTHPYQVFGKRLCIPTFTQRIKAETGFLFSKELDGGEEG